MENKIRQALSENWREFRESHPFVISGMRLASKPGTWVVALLVSTSGIRLADFFLSDPGSKGRDMSTILPDVARMIGNAIDNPISYFIIIIGAILLFRRGVRQIIKAETEETKKRESYTDEAVAALSVKVEPFLRRHETLQRIMSERANLATMQPTLEMVDRHIQQMDDLILSIKNSDPNNYSAATANHQSAHQFYALSQENWCLNNMKTMHGRKIPHTFQQLKVSQPNSEMGGAGTMLFYAEKDKSFIVSAEKAIAEWKHCRDCVREGLAEDNTKLNEEEKRLRDEW